MDRLSTFEGMHDVLGDGFGFLGSPLDELSYMQLLERLEKCEVFLVHGLGSQPVRPVVRHKPGPEGDVWAVDALLDLPAQHKLEWIGPCARQTREIGQPRKVRDAPAQEGQAKQKRAEDP